MDKHEHDRLLDNAVDNALKQLTKVLNRLPRTPHGSTGGHIAVELLARRGAVLRNLSGDDLREFEQVVEEFMSRVEAISR